MSKELNFLAPPLVEVSLGIVFEPLSGIQSAHMGRFWSSIVDDFPETADRPPIVALPPSGQSQMLTGQMADWIRLPRIWFVHKDKALLLQLQADRLYLNWRKQEEGQYPRFSGLFPFFLAYVFRWRQFVETSNLGSIRLKQFEMTYTNHIYESSLWNGFSQANNVLRPFKFNAASVGLPDPSWFAWQQTYEFEKCDVTADMKGAKRTDTMQKLLQFELRGSSGDRVISFSETETWFTEANRRLGQVFLALTSDRAQLEEWKRADA